MAEDAGREAMGEKEFVVRETKQCFRWAGWYWYWDVFRIEVREARFDEIAHLKQLRYRS
jgi:hypothetical protein